MGGAATQQRVSIRLLRGVPREQAAGPSRAKDDMHL
jgi:hypothetical protein